MVAAATAAALALPPHRDLGRPGGLRSVDIVPTDDPGGGHQSMISTATHRNELLTAPPRRPAGDPLDWEVRTIMTPGVTALVEDASLHQVYRALAAHQTHAILVVGLVDGRPLGWVTASGLLDWIESDDTLRPARDAITEEPVTIDPGATASDAVALLRRPDVSRLLVQRGPSVLPEGVVTDIDLVALRLP